jgi:hypothetical protein
MTVGWPAMLRWTEGPLRPACQLRWLPAKGPHACGCHTAASAATYILALWHAPAPQTQCQPSTGAGRQRAPAPQAPPVQRWRCRACWRAGHCLGGRPSRRRGAQGAGCWQGPGAGCSRYWPQGRHGLRGRCARCAPGQQGLCHHPWRWRHLRRHLYRMRWVWQGGRPETGGQAAVGGRREGQAAHCRATQVDWAVRRGPCHRPKSVRSSLDGCHAAAACSLQPTHLGDARPRACLRRNRAAGAPSRGRAAAVGAAAWWLTAGPAAAAGTLMRHTTLS